MAGDKDFEHNETQAEDQLQIVDPPAPGKDGQENGQQQAGAPTGGPEDPSAADQNPTGEADEQENEPLPRTWN